MGRARPRWVLPGCRLPQGLCGAVPQAGDPPNLPEGFFGPSSESGGLLANRNLRWASFVEAGTSSGMAAPNCVTSGGVG